MTITRVASIVTTVVVLASLDAGSLLSAQRRVLQSVVERDAEVRSTEPGPHDGGGQTTAYSFFKNAPDLKLVFRKRALKPGSAIGYHEQAEDEIYYVLSGRGVMTLNGKSFEVGAGDAILTRPGSSHGLKQAGADDLVILINYEQAPR
jgi:mannose-6-phosphate isomerase-like protein (cupin superfamily)